MGFATWPSYQDGTGTYMDGDVPNKALFDAIKADLEADLFSGAISPENLIDEVATARGTMASLDARLDVSINHDGTLKAIAGSVPTDELVHSLGSPVPGPIVNPSFEMWASNTGAGTPWDPLATEVPMGWALSGGMTLNSHTLGAGGISNNGRYRLNLQANSYVDNGRFYQTVIPEMEMANFMRQWETGDRKVTFGGLINPTGVPTAYAYMFVDDGVTISLSPLAVNNEADLFHRSVVHTINSHATHLIVGVQTTPLLDPAYVPFAFDFASPYLTFNDVTIPADAAPGFAPQRVPYRSGVFYTPKLGERRIASPSSLNHGNSAGAGVNTLWQYHDSVPAQGVWPDNNVITLSATGTLAANADANKILRVYVGTSWVEVINTGANIANNVWILDCTIWRTGAATALLAGRITYNGASSSVPTYNHISANLGGGALDWTTGPVLAIKGSSATVSTVILNHAAVRYVGLS